MENKNVAWVNWERLLLYTKLHTTSGSKSWMKHTKNPMHQNFRPSTSRANRINHPYQTIRVVGWMYGNELPRLPINNSFRGEKWRPAENLCFRKKKLGAQTCHRIRQSPRNCSSKLECDYARRSDRNIHNSTADLCPLHPRTTTQSKNSNPGHRHRNS